MTPGEASAAARTRVPVGERTLPGWLRFVAPVVVGVLMLALWILYVDVFAAAPRMLPSPAAIGAELVLRWDIIFEDMLVTATNALIGLVVGSLLAIVLAGLAATARPIDGMLTPLVAALAVVPIVAITPILNTMFGASSQFGRIAVATIAAFIPVFVNVLRGLRQTRPVHRDVLRASAATSAQTFRLLTLPTALPYLMTGLRIAASLAVIAALVAEYFGGPADGIGTAIATYAKSGRAALAWAYVVGGILDRAGLLPCDLAAGEAGDEALVGLTGTCTTCITQPERNSMRISTRRGLAVMSTAAVTALALAACSAPATPDASDGGSADFEPLTSVKLQLQWLPQAQFAGYYVALDQGYFEEEGFDDVEIVPSGGDIVPQDALVAGDVDFAIAWVPKVLGTLEATGVELTDIAQVYQKSGTLQVSWAGDGIESVADFEGKRIGSWGFGNEWEIFAAMAAEDLDASTVSITTQDFSMNALLDRDVDAAQAMTYNEWAQILEVVNPATGKLYQPEDFDVVSYEDTEGAMLQDAIWADTARLADDPAYADAAVRFLKAVTKGWIFARDNPEEAATITYDAAINAEAAFPVGPVHQLWQMNEVNKLIWAGGDFGLIDKAAWDKTVAGALSAKNQDGIELITTEPAESAYSNEYIEKALAELKADGVVVDGEYTPIDVVLTEGGQ